MPSIKEEAQKHEPTRRGGDLFIVDNSDTEWKVREYLREWSDMSDKFDIATENLEIGGLLALDGEWQKLKKIRVLMGNEVTRTSHQEDLSQEASGSGRGEGYAQSLDGAFLISRVR